MSCTRYERWLWEYIEGRLSPAQTELVRAHLQACASCQRRLEAAYATYRALHTLPRHHAPAHLVQRTRARLQQSPASRAAFWSGWRRSLALAPALGLLTAFAWWGWFARSPEPATPKPYHAVRDETEEWVALHEQLEIADWSPTPTASYFVSTGYTR